MNFHALKVFAMTTSLISSLPIEAAEGWNETLSDDGIVVFKRKRAGSAYEEVRAEARLAGKVDDFLPFFSNPENYKKWVYGALECAPLSKVNEADFTFRGVFQVPWPFENRELMSRVELKKKSEPEELTAKLTHVESQAQVPQGLVRVSRFESVWRVASAGDKMVDLSIEMYVEPGGSLPPFIVNLVLSRIQMWSIKNLKKEIAAR